MCELGGLEGAATQRTVTAPLQVDGFITELDIDNDVGVREEPEQCNY